MEGGPGEEVTLAGIYLGGGRQRGGFETSATIERVGTSRDYQNQSANDELSDVSGNVHRAGVGAGIKHESGEKLEARGLLGELKNKENRKPATGGTLWDPPSERLIEPGQSPL